MSSAIDLSAAEARNIANRAERAIKASRSRKAVVKLREIAAKANDLAEEIEQLDGEAEMKFYEANP